MAQFVTFQDERQEMRINTVGDFPYLEAVDPLIRRFVNAAKGLSAVASTEHADFSVLDPPVGDATYRLEILLDDGRVAQYDLSGFDPKNPEFRLTLDGGGGGWTDAELEASLPVLGTALELHARVALNDFRWERL